MQHDTLAHSTLTQTWPSQPYAAIDSSLESIPSMLSSPSTTICDAVCSVLCQTVASLRLESARNNNTIHFRPSSKMPGRRPCFLHSKTCSHQRLVLGLHCEPKPQTLKRLPCPAPRTCAKGHGTAPLDVVSTLAVKLVLDNMIIPVCTEHMPRHTINTRILTKVISCVHVRSILHVHASADVIEITSST